MQLLSLSNGAMMIRDDFKGGIDTMEPAFRFLRTATNQRRWLVISGFEETSLSPSNRMLRIARNIRENTDCVLFVGDHASVGYERAIREGMPADCVFQAFGVREAAEILRRELRSHDLILLKGLGGHHLARIYFALEEERLGSVKCWRSTCEKKIICDICPYLHGRWPWSIVGLQGAKAPAPRVGA
jgi:UDP-N-acetylmuramyl pentapeptide synthase